MKTCIIALIALALGLITVVILLLSGCTYGRINDNSAWMLGSGKFVDEGRSVECLQIPNFGRN